VTSSDVASYKLEVKRSAAKEIADIPKPDCQRVVARIQLLANDPRRHGSEKLSSAEKYRIRQGNYRILYEIDDSTKRVIIVKVGSRKEVYR
jgi:mRNA interferase RelE/StbE